MKLIFTQLCVAGILLCALNTQPLLSDDTANDRPATENREGRGLFRKSKSRVSRNNNAVRIYPDPVRRAMHVVAKENKGVEIDFFVFDLQGTLIEHLKLDSGEHERLTELERGKYIYRVFAGDEETASGNFEMR
ncbi:MAG: T9SS type A sorting domain-containing protein [Chitinophagaceae bacterium]|nr:MAG: T9SS type A sorting domain-containing protein [Chitinophagaceae bacterium]